MEIKFISYSGKYPKLCCGILTLKIDDKIAKFGYDGKPENLNNYNRFWVTQGAWTVWENNTYTASTNDWVLYEPELPDVYKPYGKKLIDIFNQNVPKGCCGGCPEREIEDIKKGKKGENNNK